jgi:hypothetical protein
MIIVLVVTSLANFGDIRLYFHIKNKRNVTNKIHTFSIFEIIPFFAACFVAWTKSARFFDHCEFKNNESIWVKNDFAKINMIIYTELFLSKKLEPFATKEIDNFSFFEKDQTNFIIKFILKKNLNKPKKMQKNIKTQPFEK